jgi:hypothetical protein
MSCLVWGLLWSVTEMVVQQTILDESKFDHTDILYAAMYQVSRDSDYLSAKGMD